MAKSRQKIPAKTPAKPILLVSAISLIKIFLFFMVGNIENNILKLPPIASYPLPITEFFTIF